MVPTLQDLDLDRFSPEDRLEIAEAIWESVVRDLEESPLSAAPSGELDRRLADSIAGPEAVTAWEVVKARALARAGQ